MKKLLFLFSVLILTISCNSQVDDTTWFPTITNITAAPTIHVSSFEMMSDDVCRCWFNMAAATSNATTKTVTLPYAAAGTSVQTFPLDIQNATILQWGMLKTKINSCIATLYISNNTATGWTSSGTIRFNFNIDYFIKVDTSSDYVQRKEIWFGNSLFNFSEGNTYFGMRASNTCYADQVDSSFVLSYCNTSTGGTQTSIMLTDYPTKIRPMLRAGDIVVLGELTNDLCTGLLTPQQAFKNMDSLAQLIVADGGIPVVVTMIARNKTTDPADIEASRLTVNDSLRNNASAHGYYIADAGVLTWCDSQADCSSSTYYDTDKVHLKNAGYDPYGLCIRTKINYILRNL